MDTVSVALVLVVVMGTIIVVFGMTIGELADSLRALEQEAITDPLTGAFNRRHLRVCLEAAVDRRIRFGEPACLVLFDVDRFKDINDTLGHAAGDAALKAMVALVGRRARKLDVLFRVGGEEFALLLAGTSVPAAIVVAEQIRVLVARSHLIEGRAVSISIGVSELREGQSPRDWIDVADRALYHAKRTGRNRVAFDGRAGAAAVRSGINDLGIFPATRRLDQTEDAQPDACRHLRA